MLDEISEIARQAGLLIKSCSVSPNKASEKEGKGNFVTEFDMKIQRFLKEKLKDLIPEAEFFGEENGEDDMRPCRLAFVVDPIDGTTNFIRDFKHSCISICLLKDNLPYIGVVYNPYLDEMFCAQTKNGAYLNGNPIRVSNMGLNNSLISFGTSPYYIDKADKTFETAKTLFKYAADLRRCGCAALDICYVAAGRCDLYFEYTLSPWDFAAGSVILKEAGGIIITSGYKELDYTKKCAVVASNPVIFKEFKNLIDF